jgi:hypothetical protein
MPSAPVRETLLTIEEVRYCDFADEETGEVCGKKLSMYNLKTTCLRHPELRRRPKHLKKILLANKILHATCAQFGMDRQTILKKVSSNPKPIEPIHVAMYLMYTDSGLALAGIAQILQRNNSKYVGDCVHSMIVRQAELGHIFAEIRARYAEAHVLEPA